MQRLLSFLLATFMLGGCTREPALTTVAHVDLTRYQGDWFVIANIPYWLEDGKVATFDRYRLRKDGRMDNEYWFRRGDFSAKEEVWKGVGWVHDTTTNAEWRVRFMWPFSTAYLIIDLDTDYRWAVIGHPSRDYFWVLARDRTLPQSIYDGILQRAATQGYDITRVKMVPQPTSP